MRQKLYKNVKDVDKFCKRQREVYKATKCELTDKGVLVEYPEKEL